jgi:hypothetical protein
MGDHLPSPCDGPLKDGGRGVPDAKNLVKRALTLAFVLRTLPSLSAPTDGRSFTDDKNFNRTAVAVEGGCPMFRYTWHFLLVALAGFINRQQQDLIAYLQEENRVLREKLGGKRVLLNVAQKRRLATAAAKLGRNALQQVATLFTPETLLKWHRLLVARKYDGFGKRGPKAVKANLIRHLVLKMKAEKAVTIGTDLQPGVVKVTLSAHSISTIVVPPN